MSDHGALLRRSRERSRISQSTLALRAGTSQAAVSDIERGRVSPSIETLRRLFTALGEDLVLSARPLPGRVDDADLRAFRAKRPSERLEDAFAAAEFSTSLHGRARE